MRRHCSPKGIFPLRLLSWVDPRGFALKPDRDFDLESDEDFDLDSKASVRLRFLSKRSDLYLRFLSELSDCFRSDLSELLCLSFGFVKDGASRPSCLVC